MTTLPEWWTVPYPEVSSPQSAAAYIDALGGALSLRQENGSWVLVTGTQELIRTSTPTEVDSFILGFALAHLICERHGPLSRQPVRLPLPGEADAPATTAPREEEVQLVEVVELVEVTEPSDDPAPEAFEPEPESPTENGDAGAGTEAVTETRPSARLAGRRRRGR